MKILTIFLLTSLVVVSFSQIIVNYGCKSYSKDGNTCLLCSERFYKDASGICQPVSSSCKTYNSTNGACLSCYSGYFLADVICAFGSSPFQSSRHSDQYCIKYVNQVCTQCSKGFYLLNSTCTMVNTLCKNFDYTKLVCIGCYSGYSLLGNGNCQVSVVGLPAAGCAQFNNSVCVKCSKGYYFDSNKNCAQANPLCKTFDQTNGVCLNCYAGFTLSAGNCTVDEASTKNPHCQKFQGQACINCSKGYYFDSNKICQQIDPLCKTFNYANSVCESCYKGFALINGVCLVSDTSPVTDRNCRAFDSNGVCLNCSKGYYFNSNKVCTEINPNCKSFDLVNLVCTACYNGYNLSGSDCIASNSSTTAAITCAQWLDGVCVKCIPRAYFNFQSNCVMVSDSCKTFNIYNGSCTSCYAGYSVDNSGLCNQTNSTISCALTDQKTGLCIKCFNGSYLSSSSVCVAIDSYCSSFNLATNLCNACYKGYSISKTGICEQTIVPTTTIQNCVQYDANNNCIKCYNLYYISNNVCVEVNPLCKTNDSNGNCLSCYSVFILKNGKCVLN